MSLPEIGIITENFANDLFRYGFGAHSGELALRIAEFLYENKSLSPVRDLTSEQKADAREIFEGKNPDRKACQHCAGLHHAVAGLPESRQPCRRIKTIKWHTDGSILEVEYWPSGEWETDVVFPGEVYDDEDDVEGDE